MNWSSLQVVPFPDFPLNSTNLDALSVMADQLWLNTEVLVALPPALLDDRAVLVVTAHHGVNHPHGT